MALTRDPTARRAATAERRLALPAAATAAAMLAALPAPGRAAEAPSAAAQETAAQIELPAGPLDLALARLSAQTGLVIRDREGLAAGRVSPALSGPWTPQAALQALLAGAGLRARMAPDGSAVLAADAPTAQLAQAAVDDPGEAVMLAPVVVEGEKLSRERFRTYASVGVTTAEDIETYAIESLDQALQRLPNVTSKPDGSGDANIVIRGLNAEGVTQPSRAAPIISVIVDGAQQGVEATRRGSRGLFDVEQVEVLRGPQSTLQGRNALGGAVIVETKDPTWAPEMIAEGEIGTEDRRSAALALSAPLIEDQVAFRVAGQIAREEKDIRYTNPAAASLKEDEFEEIRGKLLIEPNALPDLRALFTISHTHDKPGWNVVSGPDFFDRVFDDPTGTAAEFRDTYVNRYVADLDYDLSGGFALKSVTAMSDTEVQIWSPAGSTFDRDDTREARDISQDLQLTFEADDSALSGVIGLFYGHFQTDLDSVIATDQLAPFGIPRAFFQQLDATTETESFAIYADARYALTSRWTLLAGGRLLQEEVSSDFRGRALDVGATQAAIAQCAVTGCTPQAVYGSLDEKSSTTNTVFLPKVGVAYDVTADHTLALTAARGYRAGFSEAVAGSTAINEVEPEFLWSYELAWRSRWMGDRLEVNANTFWYDYENQQILTFNPAFPGQTVTQNSAESHAYGLELDARWQVQEGLEVFGAVGLLKTEFDEGQTTAGSLKGKDFPESPAATITVGGAWRHSSGAFAAADATYTGSYYSFGDVANSDAREVGAYTVVNAQVGYDLGPATVALYVRNLFDQQYVTSIDSTGANATVGEGRSFGLRLRATF